MTKQDLIAAKTGKLKFLTGHVNEGYIVKTMHNEEVYITLMPINARANRFYAVRVKDNKLFSVTVKSYLATPNTDAGYSSVRLGDEYSNKKAARVLGASLFKELQTTIEDGMKQATECRDRRSSRLLEGQVMRSQGRSTWTWSK